MKVVASAASCCFITCQCAEQRALCQRIFFRINKSCTVYTWRLHQGPQTPVSSFFAQAVVQTCHRIFFFLFRFHNSRNYSQLELINYICNGYISVHINLLQVCWFHFVFSLDIEVNKYRGFRHIFLLHSCTSVTALVYFCYTCLFLNTSCWSKIQVF